MKVSDLVAEFLAKHVKHVFTISGGADLHLLHSIWRRNDIEFICPQSEAAAGFAADAYARLSGLGVVIVTSGPGATNCVTPIAAAYCDSSPVLFITGQQTRARLESYGTRGYGFQATDICAIVRPITKFAVTVMHEAQVIPVLEQAVRIAQENRRGPVVVDLPDDVQRGTLS